MNDAGHTENQETQCRQDLAAAHRLCVREGIHEGSWNHISLTLPDRPDLILITPSGLHWSRVQPEDLIVMDGNGRIVSGQRRPNPSAWIIHYPIHQARPDARCLIHLHATYSTALFMRAGALFETRASQPAAGFHGRVAYFDVYDGTLTAREEGERMAAALSDKSVLVLRNHGILVAGSSVALAFTRAYMFERACQFQFLATLGGAPLNLIPESVAVEMAKFETLAGADELFRGWKTWIETDANSGDGRARPQ